MPVAYDLARHDNGSDAPIVARTVLVPSFVYGVDEADAPVKGDTLSQHSQQYVHL